jgi:hypothetical protein
MTSVRIPRSVRHSGATGKTLLPTLMVGTMTDLGQIVQVRKKKKYPKRYLVNTSMIAGQVWLRRDQFTVVAAT